MGSKEDTAVKADKGDLQDGNESEVCELVGDEDLHQLEECFSPYVGLKRALPKFNRVSGDRSHI